MSVLSDVVAATRQVNPIVVALLTEIVGDPDIAQEAFDVHRNEKVSVESVERMIVTAKLIRSVRG